MILPLTYFFFFFFNDTATTEIYTLSLHDALPISHLQQFRGPPQFSKRRQHRVTEHVWSHRAYPCFLSQAPKERIHILICHGLLRSLAAEFEKQMICLNIDGMCPSHVRNNLIDEIRGNIDGAWRMDRLDFSLILQLSTITNMNLVFCHIHILHKEGKELADAGCRFIQEPDQQTITPI